jgi:hypothetical protein
VVGSVAGIAAEACIAEMVRDAGLRSPAALIAEVEERMRTEGQEGFALVSSAELVHADRHSH